MTPFRAVYAAAKSMSCHLQAKNKFNNSTVQQHVCIPCS